MVIPLSVKIRTPVPRTRCTAIKSAFTSNPTAHYTKLTPAAPVTDPNDARRLLVVVEREKQRGQRYSTWVV